MNFVSTTLNFVYFHLFSTWYKVRRTLILFYVVALLIVYFFYSPTPIVISEELAREISNGLENPEFHIEQELLEQEKLLEQQEKILEQQKKEAAIGKNTTLWEWSSIIIINTVKMAIMLYPFVKGSPYNSPFKGSKK